jgi:hypothetical protein
MFLAWWWCVEVSCVDSVTMYVYNFTYPHPNNFNHRDVGILFWNDNTVHFLTVQSSKRGLSSPWKEYWCSHAHSSLGMTSRSNKSKTPLHIYDEHLLDISHCIAFCNKVCRVHDKCCLFFRPLLACKSQTGLIMLSHKYIVTAAGWQCTQV